MKELIRINKNVDGSKFVNSRELHLFLEVGKDFSTWIKDRIKQYGFEKNIDYCIVKSIPQNGGIAKDYCISIDMAKELSMVERNAKGKEARTYFIACENIAIKHAQEARQQQTQLDLPKTLSQALRAYADQVDLAESYKKEIEYQKPRAQFAEAVEGCESSVLITDLAKVLRQKGVDIGQNRLFKWLRENGYLNSRKGESYNLPTQRSMDRKWMEIKKTVVANGKKEFVATTPKITGKGQVYFVNKFLKED